MPRGPWEISLFLTGLRTDGQICCGSWNKGTLEPHQRTNKRLHLSRLSRGCLTSRVENSRSPAVAVLSTSLTVLKGCLFLWHHVGLRSRIMRLDHIINNLSGLDFTYNVARAKFEEKSPLWKCRFCVLLFCCVSLFHVYHFKLLKISNSLMSLICSCHFKKAFQTF